MILLQRIVAVLFALAVGVSQVCADEPRFEVQDSELTWIEHFSLAQPFVDEYLMNRLNHVIRADAIVKVDSYVRLTPNRQSMRGWLWSRMPVVTQKSWVIEFQFKVHGGDHLYGDGFAFWYTSERRQTGNVFGSKDEFKGLGIFFDTYANNNKNRHLFPYITAMIGDGETKYDDSDDGKSNEIGSCTAQFREKDYITRAKVVYVEDKMLQLFVDVDGTGEWKNCFTKNDVSLPLRGYFGFTSHTGDASENHDILRITSYSIQNEHTSKQTTPEPPTGGGRRVSSTGKSANKPGDSIPPPKYSPSSVNSKSNGGAQGWVWTVLLVVFCIVAVAGVGVAAFFAYQKMNQPKSYKRF
ncbi:hypothetical protein HK100_003801 [Physocladia obscura]|uniref:L-type lectin-like domain-containing protein n=1 Tax=Physocladia obscura TaxID=109957 RepID=A0AAD5XJ81_9FUNG|nr:hypothetical protein HK100_003801 [Physocladia obscura]